MSLLETIGVALVRVKVAAANIRHFLPHQAICREHLSASPGSVGMASATAQRPSGTFAARTSAGRISGGAASSRSALAISAAAIGPSMWSCLSACDAKASTIQNVVASVRRANQTTVPASLLASETAPARKDPTSSAFSSLAMSLTTKATVSARVVVFMTEPPIVQSAFLALMNRYRLGYADR